MKKKILTPEMEIINLDEEDIIVTSDGTNQEANGTNKDEGNKTIPV